MFPTPQASKPVQTNPWRQLRQTWCGRDPYGIKSQLQFCSANDLSEQEQKFNQYWHNYEDEIQRHRSGQTPTGATSASSSTTPTTLLNHHSP